ncbi:MAG: COX15/CtaA family protein [Pelobium sp.]
MYSKAEKRFLRINFISILSLFLLILAGGVVRSSGSGMGCPDWPKCFDQYIPPTNVSQLPADYREKYVQKRLEKNERFAKLLDKTGYKELAFKIRNDENIQVPEEFNPAKTYTEYINRLIGALTGIFLLLTFIFSIKLLKLRSRLFWVSGINLLLVLIQAWLGSIVVSTNLVAWIITVHMLLAILILAMSIYTYQDLKYLRNEAESTQKTDSLFKFALVLSLLISVIQITIGTEVRETVDAVQSQFPELKRGEWLLETGRIFSYHKDIAILTIVLNLYLAYKVWKEKWVGIIKKFTNYIITVLGLQILTGCALAYLAMAPWAQATHILFAVLLFSAQFYLLLLQGKKKLNIN